MTLTGKPLWPHQSSELPKLLAGHRLLAWEPGTGKTRAVLEAFALLPERPLRRRMLAVVPANVREQWRTVAREFGFKVQMIEKTNTTVDPRADIVVVSYHAIVKKTVWQSAMKLQWTVLTLDEAHYCKSPSAKWTKAVFGSKKGSKACLIANADRVWLMTGTPIMLDPSDLWVFVSRLFPDALTDGIRNKSDWVYRWCKGYETPYGFKVTDARDPDKLHELLTPFMSRAKKREVLKDLKEPIRDRFRLPPRKIPITREVSEELRALLARLDADNDNGEDFELDEFENNPQIATLRRAIGLSKAEEVAEYVVGEMVNSDEKALVFFLHTDVGHTIFRALVAAGLKPVLYDGTQSAARKAHALSAFQNDPECRVFVGQIQASGTGTDGLQVASRVFVAEEPFTPGALDQVISRADRGGQQNQVYVTTFVVSGSYDDRVSRVLEKRARIINQVIEGKAA